MPVEMGSFDVIIGMDWLLRYQAAIVCANKIVHIPWGRETLIFHGDGSNQEHEVRLNIISCAKTQKYMLKGCQVFLAHVTTKEAEGKSKKKRLENIPIIRDFIEVFPEDLPGLPPTRQVNKKEDKEHLRMILKLLKKEELPIIPLRPNLGVLQIGIKSQGYSEPALSPDYVVDSDPEKDEKDQKEDPAYGPADRGSNEDDKSSNDDYNDDDIEKDDEDKEEEEHLAPANPSDVSTDDLFKAMFFRGSFWTTVAVKKVNDVTRLQALVDKKKVVVTDATIRDAVRLDYAEGVECLPNEEIFAELASMGYEKPSTKLMFYKAFFSSQ
uniref:Reverse transcriptase domain-containing protein n=1 Tax=Tanacetum cinerariifolium TaxID=118510 RepID=A0A6L2MUG9_TANCI|nr:reverse transcriptase domain-containing protein [Tanacetum cinerariifolium]